MENNFFSWLHRTTPNVWEAIAYLKTESMGTVDQIRWCSGFSAARLDWEQPNGFVELQGYSFGKHLIHWWGKRLTEVDCENF